MPLDLSALEGVPRLLMEVPLKPVQGSRFQPTGFPDLGAATFTGIRQENGQAVEVDSLLVESAQSMANRLELACWDDTADDGRGNFREELRGIPFVRCDLPNGRTVSSVTESHRLNSPYFQATEFQKKLCEEVGYKKGEVWRIEKLAEFLFQRDPNSLLHGVFFSSIHDGRMRLPRVLSAFIEAELPRNGKGYAESGFARREDADPSGEEGAALLDDVPDDLFKDMGYSKPGEYRGKLKDNVKNIIGPCTEFTATKITAFFHLDLAQIRGFSLPREESDFLTAFALYKIQRFLSDGMRLRSRCTFEVAGDIASRPDFDLPSIEQLKEELPRLIGKVKFGEPVITEIQFPQKKARK